MTNGIQRIHCWALLCAVCFSGCKTATQSGDSRKASALSHAITVEERSSDFYGGHPRIIPEEVVRPRVDYKSDLRLIIKTNELLAQLGSSPDLLPPLTTVQKDRLAFLAQTLTAAREYLRDYNTLAKEFEALQSRPDKLDSLKQLIQRQGQSGLNVMVPLRKYIDAKIQEENPNLTQSQIIKQRDQVADTFLPKGVVLDLGALSRFLDSESSAVIRQALLDAKTVRDQGSVRLRLRATILQPGKAELRLHIRNYDTLTDTDVPQEPRISFQMSEADRARLTAETKVNTEAAQLIKDLQDSKSRIRESLNSVFDSLRRDLSNLQNAGTNLNQLQQKLQTLFVALTNALPSSKLTQTQREVIQNARDTVSAVQSDIGQIQNAVSGLLNRTAPDTDPSQLLLETADSLFQALAGVSQLTKDAVSGLERALTALESLVSEIKTSIPDDVPRLKDLADFFLDSATNSATAAALRGLLDESLKSYPNLLAALGSLTTKAHVLAADIPPIHTDPVLLDVDVANHPDGYISLARNVPSGGVTVAVDAALIKRKDGDVPPEVKPVDHQELRVEKFGVINTWAANLILVNRLGDLAPNEQDVQFSPAPSISWTLHYSPPPETEPPNKWWETLYPGLGLNIAALSWNNGLQVGLGGHLSLFHDLLMVGGGYNLNESRNGGYVFVGIGLFQTFNQLGLTDFSFAK